MVGVPSTGRPPVSNSCTQEEELTGDKPTHLLILILIINKRRQGGKGGVSLGDKSSFKVLLSWKEQL